MKQRIKIFTGLLFILLLTSNCGASALSQGFEALAIHDYFKAKKIFYKALKKHPSAAGYGLSVIYLRKNNPFYNLDSALHYAQVSTSAYWNGTSEKQKLSYIILGVDTVSICGQRDAVDEKCFGRAQERNTIKAYNDFITINEGALQLDQAILYRNALAYAIVLKNNTSYSYLKFMKDYPRAQEFDEAKARYDKQLFKEYTIDRTIASNVRFMTEQPHSFYVAKAQANIYELATRSKTAEAYYQFVKSYPQNPDVPKAWRNVYNLSTQVRTPENIKKFLDQFPNYPFKEELEQDYVLSNTQYYQLKKKGKWGFVDEELKVVIPPVYSWSSPFSEGAAAVMLNGKVGFINKNQHTVIPFEYDEAEPFINGLAIVGKKDKYGLINRTGETIVPIIYDDIGETNGTFISIELNGKYGFIDRKGNLKVGLQYESVGDFYNGIAYVKQDGLFGIIDSNLFYVVKPKYQWIDNLKNNFIRIQEAGKYGVIDVKGKSIIEPIYDQLSELENGYAMGIKEGFYGYVKADGAVVIPIAIPFTEGVLNWGMFNASGFARIRTEARFGLIDSVGSNFVPALFEDIGAVSNTFIAIKRHGKWGYCDYDTKLRIPYNFDYAAGFVDGFAVVLVEDQVGLIDEKGSYVIAPEYESIKRFHRHTFLAKKGEKYGVIDTHQNVLIPFNYVKIEVSMDGALIRLHGADGYEYQKMATVFGE